MVAPRHPDRLTEALETRLQEVHVVVGLRILESWAAAADISFRQLRLLLTLRLTSEACPAEELAGLSGIPINDIFPVLQDLIGRGEVRETGRRYTLTEKGNESLRSLEAARRAGIADYVSGLDADARKRVAFSLGLDADS